MSRSLCVPRRTQYIGCSFDVAMHKLVCLYTEAYCALVRCGWPPEDLEIELQ